MAKFRVKSGIVELKTKDPFLRSFKVPAGKHKITKINVYSNNKNHYFTMVINTLEKNWTKKNLLQSEVMEILKSHANGGRSDSKCIF